MQSINHYMVSGSNDVDSMVSAISVRLMEGWRVIQIQPIQVRDGSTVSVVVVMEDDDNDTVTSVHVDSVSLDIETFG